MCAPHVCGPKAPGRASDLLELELRMIGSSHVGARNPTKVLASAANRLDH